MQRERENERVWEYETERQSVSECDKCKCPIGSSRTEVETCSIVGGARIAAVRPVGVAPHPPPNTHKYTQRSRE